MSKFKNNLSEGKVTKKLFAFAMPFIISNLIQSLYSVADMIIVGQIAGTSSMSGVNIGSQITVLVTNAVIGLCAGATVLIGQYTGSGREEQLKHTISTLFSVLIVLAVFFTVTMITFSDPVLKLINTPETSYSEAKKYFFVTMLGTVFIFGYNALSAVMRGMGDSKTPLKFIGVACFTNIILDLILVPIFNTYLNGNAALAAAIATVASQAVSMILCIIYLRKNNFIFDFNKSSFKFHPDQLKLLMKIGIPTTVNNIAVSSSFLFLTSMVNSLGEKASAALGAVAKYNGFAILPAIAIGSAVSAMCAQNIGANKPERAVKTMYTGIAMAFSISAAVFMLTLLFPEYILRAFDDDVEMIALGIEYIRFFSFDYLLVPLLFNLNGLFIGSGHTRFSLFNGILSSLLIRIPASYFFGMYLGMNMKGLGLGAPSASLFALIVALLFYISGRWKKQVIPDHIS